MSNKSRYDEKLILDFFAQSVLEKGYDETSMRMIANNFNMPVSSLYRLFSSKEEMLDKVLKPVIDIFNGLYELYKDKNYDCLKELSLEKIFEMQRTPIEFVDIMFKYHNEFKILLSHLKGTKYENFSEDLINYEIQSTYEFFDKLKENGFIIKEIDEKYLRILVESNFHAYFSIIKNNLSYDESVEFMNLISDYSTEGYKALFIKK